MPLACEVMPECDLRFAPEPSIRHELERAFEGPEFPSVEDAFSRPGAGFFVDPSLTDRCSGRRRIAFADRRGARDRAPRRIRRRGRRRRRRCRERDVRSQERPTDSVRSERLWLSRRLGRLTLDFDGSVLSTAGRCKEGTAGPRRTRSSGQRFGCSSRSEHLEDVSSREPAD